MVILLIVVNVIILIMVFYVLIQIFKTMNPFMEKELENTIINRMILCEKIIIALSILALVIIFYFGEVTVESIRPYQINIIIWILIIAVSIGKKKDTID